MYTAFVEASSLGFVSDEQMAFILDWAIEVGLTVLGVSYSSMGSEAIGPLA